MPEYITLSDIDSSDETYRITHDDTIVSLARSIKEAGLINMPLVRKKDQGYVVVCGFKRIKALIHNGIDKTNVKVLEETGDSDLKAAVLAVSDNAFQRPLDTMEQAAGVLLLSKLMTLDTIAEKSLSIFNTSMNSRLVRKLIDLGSMPGNVHDLINQGRLSMTAALRLKKYPKETLTAFVRLFYSVKTGHSKQIEIITNIHEVAAREDRSPLDLIQSNDIQAIIENQDIDPTRKGNLLRSYLAKRRYPEISRTNELFFKLVKQLSPGSDLAINPPVNFEARDYTIAFKFASHGELVKKTEKLKLVTCDPMIKQLIQ